MLELDNCPQITDSALSHMRHAKALKRIDLYDCQNVSKEAIQRFKVNSNYLSVFYLVFFFAQLRSLLFDFNDFSFFH